MCCKDILAVMMSRLQLTGIMFRSAWSSVVDRYRHLIRRHLIIMTRAFV